MPRKTEPAASQPDGTAREARRAETRLVSYRPVAHCLWLWPFLLVSASLGAHPAFSTQRPQVVNALSDNQPVTISGKIDRITDENEFRLDSELGDIRVYLGPNWVPAYVGDFITVYGYVQWDVGQMHVRAHRMTHSDGTVTTFEGLQD